MLYTVLITLHVPGPWGEGETIAGQPAAKPLAQHDSQYSRSTCSQCHATKCLKRGGDDDDDDDGWFINWILCIGFTSEKGMLKIAGLRSAHKHAEAQVGKLSKLETKSDYAHVYSQTRNVPQLFLECCLSNSARHCPYSCPCPIDSSGDIGRAPVLTDAFLVLLTVHVAWKGQFCLGEVEEIASWGDETTVHTNKSEGLWG